MRTAVNFQYRSSQLRKRRVLALPSHGGRKCNSTLLQQQREVLENVGPIIFGGAAEEPEQAHRFEDAEASRDFEAPAHQKS